MAAFCASVGAAWNSTRVRPAFASNAMFQPLPVIVVPIQGLSAGAGLSCAGAGLSCAGAGLLCFA